MPRPKKAPEPAKRGPGRAAKPAPPKAERIHLRLSPEQLKVARRRAERRETTLTALALDGLLGTDEQAELAAWRAGRASTLREMQADIERMLHEAEPTYREKVERAGRIMGERISHIIVDDPHKAVRPGAPKPVAE